MKLRVIDGGGAPAPAPKRHAPDPGQVLVVAFRFAIGFLHGLALGVGRFICWALTVAMVAALLGYEVSWSLCGLVLAVNVIGYLFYPGRAVDGEPT